jgi:hypothetical protein
MTFVGNLGGGMAASFTVLAIITVGNVITTYITPSKATLQEVIDSRISGAAQAVV